MPLLVLPTNHQSRNMITTEKMIEQKFNWLYDIGENGHV